MPWYNGMRCMSFPVIIMIYRYQCFQVIYIGENRIQNIHPSAFQGLTIQRLLIFSSILKHMLPVNDICEFLKKCVLVCDHPQAMHIDRHHFTACPSILHLEIRGCGILDISWLVHLSNTIEYIDLSNNAISSLAPLHGTVFNNLGVVKLNHNKISNIEHLFLILPAVGWVELEHNRLSHVNLTGCQWGRGLHYGTRVEFSANPWNCSDQHDWLQEGWQWKRGSTAWHLLHGSECFIRLDKIEPGKCWSSLPVLSDKTWADGLDEMYTIPEGTINTSVHTTGEILKF